MKNLSVIICTTLLLAVIITSGCINQETTTASSIRVTALAQPSQIYIGTQTTVYLDVENIDNRVLDTFTVNIFDTGMLQKTNGKDCISTTKELLPNQIKTMACKLVAPAGTSLAKTTTSTQAMYSISFIKSTSLPLTFDIMSEDEYRLQQEAGKLASDSQLFTYSDNNIRIEAELSKSPPIITRDKEKVFLYIRIRNIGSGFLESIEKGDFSIDNIDMNNCDFPDKQAPDAVLKPDKGIFPTITCEIIIPNKDKNYLSKIMQIINYKYKYNIRGSVPITIIR